MSVIEPPVTVHARRYASMLDSENARSNFIVRLQVTHDTDLLQRLAREHGLVPEIILPVWMRLEQLLPENEELLLEAAAVFFSFGYDEDAHERVERVVAARPTWVPALELKAALTPDVRERRMVYEEILRVDPGNRRAVDHLIVLEKSGR